MDVLDRCIDPVDQTGVDLDDTYQDVRMCAPWHGLDLLDCENPNGAGEEALCDDLTERCQARCEAEVQLPPEVEGFALDRVECVVTISDELGYGPTDYNPECSYSELLRVDHRFPAWADGLDEDYKPCSLESCSSASCSAYDPIGGIGSTRGTRESYAIIHRGLLDSLRVDPLALWECDHGRYAETVISRADSPDGTPTSEWRFESLEPGGLLYELGLRNGDANGRVWAYDPATGAPTTPVYELDSVETLAKAYSVLVGEPNVSIEVDRVRATTTTPHRILVSVEECGIDRDGDGTTDIVRCPNP